MFILVWLYIQIAIEAGDKNENTFDKSCKNSNE